MVVISFMCSVYYNMIIAYTLYYVFASFTSELPWQHCRPEWLQYGCVEKHNATARNQTGKSSVCKSQGQCRSDLQTRFSLGLLSNFRFDLVSQVQIHCSNFNIIISSRLSISRMHRSNFDGVLFSEAFSCRFKLI